MDGLFARILAFSKGTVGKSLGAAVAAIVIGAAAFWAGRATAPVQHAPRVVTAEPSDDDYADDTPSSDAAAPAPQSVEHHARGHRGGDAGAAVIAAATKTSGAKYVHRNNSDLRKAPSYASETLKKEPKGAKLEMVALSDKWAEVKDGDVEGWMRASVLKDTPPDAPGTKHPRKKKDSSD